MREVSLNIGFGEWMECNLVQYIYTEEKTYAVLIQKNQEVLIVEVMYNTSWKHIVYLPVEEEKQLELFEVFKKGFRYSAWEHEENLESVVLTDKLIQAYK